MSEININELGLQRFSNFCKKIKELLVDRKINFDLIVASGNSGLAMGKYAAIIYKELGKEFPQQLSIPFYRFPPGHRDELDKKFDSSFFLPEVQKQIENININSVLFVDDEIGLGITALSILNLLNEALRLQCKDPIRAYYIVAEDQGFKVPEDRKEIQFFPYDKETDGYNNVIFFVTPSELEKPIIEVFGDDDKFPFHQRCNLLLNLPIKDFNNGKPIWTNKYLETAKEKISSFSDLQKRYLEYTASLVQKYIK